MFAAAEPHRAQDGTRPLDALAFATRRLDEERVVVLVSARGAMPPVGLERDFPQLLLKPLPLADEPPREPPAPPLDLPAAPPDSDAPLPARPPVLVAPDEPPSWPPVPRLSDVGEVQLQSSAATARVATHPDRSGLSAGGLSWPAVIAGRAIAFEPERRLRSL